MATWQAIVGTTTYELSDGAPFHRLSSTGIGIAPIVRLSQSGPYQDGGTDLGFRLQSRQINLIIFFANASLSAADTYRDTIESIFKPLTSTPIKIRVTRDDGAIRQIDCYSTGIIDMPDTNPQRFPGTQQVLIQLQAIDPIWYDPTLNNTAYGGVTGGTEGFQIPVDLPWDQASGTVIDETDIITYTGTWKEFPVIKITGPATDCIVTNLSTNETLDFTGSTIAALDIYTIDLRYGAKSIKDSAGASQVGDLTAASDLATWHLAPDPEVPDGINDIYVSATSGTTATAINIEYYQRYTKA